MKRKEQEKLKLFRENRRIFKNFNISKLSFFHGQNCKNLCLPFSHQSTEEARHFSQSEGVKSLLFKSCGGDERGGGIADNEKDRRTRTARTRPEFVILRISGLDFGFSPGVSEVFLLILDFKEGEGFVICQQKYPCRM
jgi:hypothetical protein